MDGPITPMSSEELRHLLVELTKLTERLASLEQRILERLEQFQREIDLKTDHREFDPIQKLVYGMTGLMLVGLCAALIRMVIK